MKNYKLLLSFFLFSVISMGQNKINESASYQKTVQFSTPISKENAVASFLSRSGLSNDNTFISKKETANDNGLTHQRNQQYYKGIKVEFGTLITHTLNGNVASINAELYNAQSLNLTPAFDANQGLQYAVSNVNATKYLWDNAQQSEIIGYQKPTGELVIFPIVKTGEVKLAYKYDVYALEPLSRDEVFVDAHTGQILYKNPIIKHAHDNHLSSISNEMPITENDFEALITGNANTKYSGLRSIETTFNPALNSYRLEDTTRGAHIITYNCQNIVNTYQNVHFTDNDNNWTTAEHSANFNNAAQDGHWGAEMTYDFWKTIFNRNGYDDANGEIKSYVHYKPTGATWANATWNGSFMSYGDGNNKPFTSIDICGHEIGHGICQYTAGLAYQNQSGAMNEGYSDIWGACIEHFGRTGAITGTPVANVWKVGEDVQTGGLRSMSNPLTQGDPDTFRGTNWFVTGDDGACIPNANTNDHCGVHTNSGVMNRWFYVLTIGASGTNNAPIAERDTYSVAGIGLLKAAQIAYLAERDYLTPNSTYFDARDATIAAAMSLYCAVSPEVRAVTNAWFSVNIGPSFTSFANDVAIKDIPVTSSLACNGATTYTPTILFENDGTNPISSVTITYNVDGGANSTATWTGSIATCSIGSQQLNINTSALTRGTHIVNVTTTIAGDGNNSNNTKSVVIFVNNATTVNTINTFESASDVLVSYDEGGTNNVWQRGSSTKVVLTNTVANNSKVYATNINSTYVPATKSYLVSQCYDLSQQASPVLKFNMAFDIENATDVLYMQYSTDGGSTWALLGNDTETTWYTSNYGCQLCPGGEWTGEADVTNISNTTNGTLREYSTDLSAFGSSSATPQSNMLFRFVFQSNDVNELDGVIIDNFVIESLLSNQQNTFNNFNVYPNPTENQINFSFASQSNEKINAVLYDAQGRLIKEINFNSNAGNVNYTIDVNSIPMGFYLLKIQQGNLNYNTKILKK